MPNTRCIVRFKAEMVGRFRFTASAKQRACLIELIAPLYNHAIVMDAGFRQLVDAAKA
jgi:hypothetical protein